MLVDDDELQDLLLVGSKLTFFESGPGGVHIRLDRFLVIDINFGWFKGVIQQVIFRYSLDYLSVLFTSEVFSSSPQSFQVFNIRCGH